MIRYFVILFLLTASFVVTTTADAQWASDSTTNTKVCDATGIQSNPTSCTDGANGTIIVWEDFRSGNGWDLYAQKLDANGHAVWTNNGIPVCTETHDQHRPIIASDNSGGAYVVWQDSRNSTTGLDLYGQHINSNGSLGYATAGIPVDSSVQIQTLAQITSDGNGNAWVVWEDNRSATLSSRPDIYMNKMTPSGMSFGKTGFAVTTQTGTQHRPAICDDGTGGCYVAWENGSTVPNTVMAQRYNSSGSPQWTTPNGITVFKGDNPASYCKNISLRRDGSEAMIAWELTSTNSSSGQDILVNRLHSDSTKVWYSPAEVTGDWFGDQVYPQAFSDDSTGTSPNTEAGVMVLFEDNSSTTDIDVAMVRVFPNGVNRAPSYINGFYYIVKQAYGQVGFQAVKTDPGNLLVVWNDARRNSGIDTLIYTQRVDRTLLRYFPRTGLVTTWGEPIAVRPGASAKQLTFTSRTNGGIVAWTDTRNSSSDIYAQLIFKDGSLPIELSQFRVTSAHSNEANLFWKTSAELGNAGFEIQRRKLDHTIDNSYQFVASYVTDNSLRGAGTSNLEHSYSYTDQTLTPGIYEYRLIDIALDGTRTAHEPKQVDNRKDLTTPAFTLGANVPNPVSNVTLLPITLPVDAMLDVTIVDVTGRTILSPMRHRMFSSGPHDLQVDLSGLPNGNYLLRCIASDPTDGGILWQNPTPVMIQVRK